jgi:hypothetical protein
MNIIVPGNFAAGLVGKTLSPDAKLLVQSNSYSNFVDMSAEGSALTAIGDVSWLSSGLLVKGEGSRVKTSLLDDSDAVTFRALVRVELGTEANVSCGVLGSYATPAGLGGIGLFTWPVNTAGVHSLQVRLSFAQKTLATGAKSVGVGAITVTGKTNLPTTVADTGWLYIIGKLDGATGLGKVKVMNTAQSGDIIVPATLSAKVVDRGMVDSVGAPLVHSVGSTTQSIGGRRVTTAKAEVFKRITTEIEDLAQYAADKEFLCPAFGISTVGWA